MWLSELTLQLVGFRFLAMLFIAGLHGGLVAGTAVLLGDKGPRYDARVTLSPVSHLDLVGTVSMILFGLGWSKPVDIDKGELRVGRVGLVLVILAGFIGLLALTLVLNFLVVPALTLLPHTAGLTTAAFLRVASSLTIWAALLSLVPVPPLAGGLVLAALGLRISRTVTLALLALVVLGVVSGQVRAFLAPAHAALSFALLGG